MENVEKKLTNARVVIYSIKPPWMKTYSLNLLIYKDILNYTYLSSPIIFIISCYLLYLIQNMDHILLTTSGFSEAVECEQNSSLSRRATGNNDRDQALEGVHRRTPVEGTCTCLHHKMAERTCSRLYYPIKTTLLFSYVQIPLQWNKKNVNCSKCIIKIIYLINKTLQQAGYKQQNASWATAAISQNSVSLVSWTHRDL